MSYRERLLAASSGLAPFTFYLDTNGDGSGTKSAIGDYGAGETFYIHAPPNRILKIHELHIFVEDSAINADDYGGLLGGLTNGITLSVENDGGVLADLTDGVPIKTSAAWGRVCDELVVFEWGAGGEFLTGQWIFDDAAPVIIRGDSVNSVGPDGNRLVVNLADDFTGLISQYFIAKGRVMST